jgi:hypothetical protein
MAEHRRVARLGSATKWGDRCNIPLLARLREAWPNRKPEDRLENRLAFVLGWLSHRAADRQMKPVFRANDNQTRAPRDCSLYDDICVLQKVYALDADSIYTPAVLGAERLLPEDAWRRVKEIFQILLEQSLVELHTFTPDPEHPWGWTDEVVRRFEGFYVDIDRYAKAFVNPDPVKYKQFVVDTNFYLDDDPVIVCARAIQRGEALSADDADRAVALPALSDYGRALRLSFDYLRAASDFFEGRIEEAELAEKLNIGKLGSDGVAV